MVGLGDLGRLPAGQRVTLQRAEYDDWGIRAGCLGGQLPGIFRRPCARIIAVEDNQVGSRLSSRCQSPLGGADLDSLCAATRKQRSQHFAIIERAINDQDASWIGQGVNFLQ